MTKIKKLTPHEAQKIAAGEVVERPANVLKELLENAIDAQSSKIAIYIKDGGKTLLRVVDNGCGMSPDDAQLCFEQHATSKITHVNELNTIATFGFRGEALASIAAVSKTTLITKEDIAQEGTKIQIDAGTQAQPEAASANTGTDITVKDIFFNLPARKKFLKTKETEWRQIQQLFFAFCLAHQEIEFKLYSEDKLLYNCPRTQKLEDRVAHLFEPAMAKHIMPVNNIHKQIRIEGIISNHQLQRYDRSSIYLFVNKRWVKDSNLTRAFLKGYHQVLPPGRYPAGALFITVDPTQVDINIHPRKEEVQFLHPMHAQQAITSTITHALEQNLSQQLQRSVQFKPSIAIERPAAPYSYQATFEPKSFNPFNFDQFLTSTPYTTQQPIAQPQEALATFDSTRDIAHIPQQELQSSMQEHAYRVIGQFDTTYILLEQDDGLLMIDQHAAHERILYEQFCATEGNIPSMQLMFAHMVRMSHDDIETLIKHTDLFLRYGIELEPFGNDTLKINGAPLQLKHAPFDEIIKDALGYIHAHQHEDTATFESMLQKKLFADMACKAAVKAGDLLSIEQMQELVQNLYDTNTRFSCPHGRPTFWLLHLDEIKKKFKRDYKSQNETEL